MLSWPKKLRLQLGVLALLSACGGEPENNAPSEPEEETGNSTSTEQSSSKSPSDPQDTSADEGSSSKQALAPSWENFGDAFLRNWCKGCHSPHLEGAARYGAPAGVDLMTLKDLRQWLDRVERRATGKSPSMPPAGGPSAQERERLREWLQSGAPADSDL